MGLLFESDFMAGDDGSSPHISVSVTPASIGYPLQAVDHSSSSWSTSSFHRSMAPSPPNMHGQAALPLITADGDSGIIGPSLHLVPATPIGIERPLQSESFQSNLEPLQQGQTPSLHHSPV
ncbi:hypothetical protein FIBSPDRAFT_951734 [Athelia psychrophila]|uniref:Uncharacterized protein n=1 Tax=Athelia psychrophila TaxID=1759441 RepID=A0A166MBZ1_9AGAM|nr:hypothetical protein FIBSPDRAFT_951734 [Fibularhizoctonia sp. CBS 109695]